MNDCVDPTFLAEMQQLEAYNARIRQGKMPIRREFNTPNVDTRIAITSYLALTFLLTAIASNNNDDSSLEALQGQGRAGTRPAYTFGTFSSGRCLDALSCMRTGMQPVWGTEVCEEKRALWRLITSCPDLGDTFEATLDKSMRPNVLWSGQPCMDYSLSGSRKGQHGKTGWMFVQQTEQILRVQPDAVVLDMVANATQIHGGKALRSVCKDSGSAYMIRVRKLRVRDYGDESNRERLFVVGMHKRLGDTDFKFSTGGPTSTNVARDIAQPDSEVPERFWVNVHTCTNKFASKVAGQLNKLAQLAPGMGHSSRPSSTHSWDGTFNMGTTHNSGGMRPPWTGWAQGDYMYLTKARKTTPIEAARMASTSLPDERQSRR